MTTQEIFLILYQATLIPVACYSGLCIIITIINLKVDWSHNCHIKPLQDYPFITVQILSYNDPIASRCIKACLNFHYPKDRYEVMILDDSTDKLTANILAKLADRYPNLVRYFHRDNRTGYKPGALKAVMPHVRGSLIVIFDADFIPQQNFLEYIAQPFENPEVAIVQARQAFLNERQNLITRFASYILNIHNFILMPINHYCNTVFFCGTAGALRKQAIEEVGGWNTHSITEDSDLSVRLLAKGYRSIYLPFVTPSELPVTLKAFFKQQMRWCYGNVRVFFEHTRLILYRSNLSLHQRLLITFMTMGTVIAPAVILMTITGLMGWVTGDPGHIITIWDIWDFFYKFFLTSGFLVMGFVMLHKRGQLSEFPYFLLCGIFLGFMLTCALTIALYKAVFRPHKHLFAQQTSWIVTPKEGNKWFK